MMRVLTVLAGLIAVAAAPALAQTDPSSQARQAGANQLGLMEYCQAQGFVGDDAVAAQRSAMERLPASNASTIDAEAAGKTGTMLVPNGTKTTLASMASSQGGTVSDLCKRMGNSAVQAASMMRNMPAGLPQMPAGMPAMPSGMPTLPGMPGAAPSK